MQLNFEYGKQAKQAGMQQAVDHADAVHRNWAERAHAYVMDYLNRQPAGYLFLSENIRVMAEADGFPVPPSKRAWGSVIQKIAAAGIIVSAGIAKTANPKTHNAFATQWRKQK